MSVFTNPASHSIEQAQEYVSAVLELLGKRDPLEILPHTPNELRNLVAGLSTEQLNTAETTGKWSIRHVLQHLADSEIVWANRLRMVLAHDRPSLAGYDQDLWAERLHYEEVDARQALHDFASVRDINLRQLKRARPVDFERIGIHAERGEQSVEHLLRLHAGHDVLHVRQVERILRRLGLNAYHSPSLNS